MPDITVTGQQRFYIVQALRSKATKSIGDLSEGRVLLSILDKFEFSPDEMKKCFAPVGKTGNSLIDWPMIEKYPVTANLPPSEIIKLRGRMEEWRQDERFVFNVEDLRWYLPLLDQLPESGSV